MNNPLEQEINKESQSRFSVKHMAFLLLGAIFLAVGFLLYRQQLIYRNAPMQPPATSYPSPEIISQAPQADVTLVARPEIERTRPWIEPRIETDMLRPYVVGSVVPVTLYAYSGGHDVTGYDVLLSYDPSQFEVVIAKSLLDQYQTYQFDRKSHLAITGIKQLEEKNAFTFDSIPIVEVQLKVKKAGNAHIAVSSQVKSEKTQFVDAAVVVTTPQVGAVDFTIK